MTVSEKKTELVIEYDSRTGVSRRLPWDQYGWTDINEWEHAANEHVIDPTENWWRFPHD